MLQTLPYIAILSRPRKPEAMDALQLQCNEPECCDNLAGMHENHNLMHASCVGGSPPSPVVPQDLYELHQKGELAHEDLQVVECCCAGEESI
jgi:hypothetical protein